MGDTSIEWATKVWNPVTGCTKISQGCRNCYAARMAKRLAGRAGYPPAPNEFKVTLHPERLEEPLHWKKPARIFVNSMSDLFHKDVPFAFIESVFEVMMIAKNHTFLVLTKRPDRMNDFWRWCTDNHLRLGDRWSLPNVWLGVSVEDQKAADERIPLLLDTPATIRFVSCEPLLGPVDLTNIRLPDEFQPEWAGLTGGLGFNALDNTDSNKLRNHVNELDWVIAGGESGPGARPMHPAWARGLRDQCLAAGVPFFFKQWGEWAPGSAYISYPQQTITFADDQQQAMVKIGKKKAGRLLDGKEWNELPNV